MSAIKTHLVPLGVKLPQEDRKVVGGYFVWLTLPPRIRASLLSRRLRDTVNLVVAEGELFEVPGDDTCSFKYDIRLCFAWEEEERLDEGIRRLAEVLGAMQGEAEGISGLSRKEVGEGERDVKEGESSGFW
jgi:DNA-binding transcriptional MocR family regulator